MVLAQNIGGGTTTDDYSPVEGGTEEEGSPIPKPQPEATPGLSNFELADDDNEGNNVQVETIKPEELEI